MLHRHLQDSKDRESSHPESHTNYRYLNTPQKKVRMQSLRQKVNVCQVRVKRLKERIAKQAEERGIEVDSDLHEDLAMTMDEHSARIGSEHPPGSFPHIFWEQQYKSMKISDARSMKWEPAMIRSVFINLSPTFMWCVCVCV